MAGDRISYRLVTKESPLRERYDALLTALQALGFEVELHGLIVLKVISVHV